MFWLFSRIIFLRDPKPSWIILICFSEDIFAILPSLASNLFFLLDIKIKVNDASINSINVRFRFTTNNVDEMISHIKRIESNIIIDFMGQGMVAPSWEKPEVWYTTNIAIKARLMNALIDSSFFPL